MKLLGQTMHRSAGCTNVLIKPPKAPCWRDFVCGSDDLGNSKHLCFTDLQSIQKDKFQLISGEGGNVSSLSTSQSKSDLCGQNRSTSPRSSKQGKRTRTKLHRTRSEVLIREEDLPNGSLTSTLGETKPTEFGLIMERIPICDNRRYLEENTKRCQNWLASVEASLPLDDIGPSATVTSSAHIEISEESGEGKGDLSPQSLYRFSNPGSDLPCHDVTTTTTLTGAKQAIVSRPRGRRSETSDNNCDKVLSPDSRLRHDSPFMLDSCGLFDASKVNIKGSASVR